jgi:hypothetical protein
MSLALCLIALWAWFCLVFFGKPATAFFFLIPVMVVATLYAGVVGAIRGIFDFFYELFGGY